jgi:hypothetical protein
MPESSVDSLDRNAALKAAGIGLAGQLAMVFGGNVDADIAQMFPTLGTTIAGVAGLMYPLFRRGLSSKQAAIGGALAGGGGAVLGILVSYLLGDVPLPVVAIGGGMSTVAGGIGGVIGRLITAKTPR